LVEDTWHLFFDDANPAVPNLDADPVALAAAAQQDLAVISVPDRIGQQVANYFFEHAPITVNHKLRKYHTTSQTLFFNEIEKIGCNRMENFSNCKVRL